MTVKESPADNSPLTDEELEYFKEKLLKEQKETKQKIKETKENLDELNKNAGDAKSSQDHHHGNLATDEDTKLTHLAILEKAQEKLDQITVAVDRIAAGNYGICVETGRPIQKERLEAMPYAIRSVGVKE